MVDSPFNEASKNVTFFQGGSNFREGTARKVRENGVLTGTSIVLQIGE